MILRRRTVNVHVPACRNYLVNDLQATLTLTLTMTLTLAVKLTLNVTHCDCDTQAV